MHEAFILGTGDTDLRRILSMMLACLALWIVASMSWAAEDKWEWKKEMPTPRLMHSVCSTNDGNFLAIGCQWQNENAIL